MGTKHANSEGANRVSLAHTCNDSVVYIDSGLVNAERRKGSIIPVFCPREHAERDLSYLVIGEFHVNYATTLVQRCFSNQLADIARLRLPGD